MTVTIRQDEKSASDSNGNVFAIDGIIIGKPNSVDAYYDIRSSFCRACLFPGLKVQAVISGPQHINIF